MHNIGILYHPQKAAAKPLAYQVGEWLTAQHRAVWIAPGRDEPNMLAQVAQSDLLIVLGGDGSMLRAARLAAPSQTPLLGINLGRVGFLSEATPTNWQSQLQELLIGNFWLEHRLMLAATCQRDNAPPINLVALNDVVIGRATQARVVRLELYVDGDYVTTYMADALIAATPTGSTAYAMAAGGPLLPPQLFNFLVIPVAPHLSLDRAVVLHEKAIVTIRPLMDHDAAVTADGQDSILLNNGDQVTISRYEHDTCFVRLGNSSYFYHRLMERFGFWHPQTGPETSTIS